MYYANLIHLNNNIFCLHLQNLNYNHYYFLFLDIDLAKLKLQSFFIAKQKSNSFMVDNQFIVAS